MESLDRACRLVLSPFVRVGFKREELHFGFGSLRKIVKDATLQRVLLEAAALFKRPLLLDDASAKLQAQGFGKDLVDEALTILADRCLLSEGRYQEQHRHSRSHLYYALSGAYSDAVQNKLEAAHVAIVGCGGIGNFIASLLATAGIGEMTLIDDDRVTLSNLNRQILYTEEDCTKFKVDCLGLALQQRASTLSVHTLKQSIDDSNIDCLEAMDFIVLSGDSPGLVDIVNRFAVTQNIPYLNVGYVEDIAVWGPLVIPGQTGCMGCKNHSATAELADAYLSDLCQTINLDYRAPANGPITTLASSLATLDILRVIGNFGVPESLNCRVGLWTHELRIEKQDFARNPNCPVCGRR